MKRLGIIAWLLGASVPSLAATEEHKRPPVPDWQTQAGQCSWRWLEAGGLGLWAEACNLSTGKWRIGWDRSRNAFVELHNGRPTRIVVQSWKIGPEGIAALTNKLVTAGHLLPTADCRWQSLPLGPAPRTMTFYILGPADPKALAPTGSGDIPEPVCGPYGASTHGVRYFMADIRWSDRAVFIDEGQERPMFAPTSIKFLPETGANKRRIF